LIENGSRLLIAVVQIPRAGVALAGFSRHYSKEKCLFLSAAALVRNAQTARGAAQLKPFIRLLLLLGRNQCLASIATLPDARLGNELRPAAAALLRHGFFERKDSRLLRQKMGIVKIAMIHLLYLAYNVSVLRLTKDLRKIPSRRQSPGELCRFLHYTAIGW
jgi:hypothetical protein